MSSVGTYLRELRQRRGVSLEEIARTTRVAQRYLESIEADTFDTLPSPVFTRGFIRAYCQALSEPPDEALAAYERREPDAPPAPAPGRAGYTGSRPGAMAPRPSASAPRPSASAPRPSASAPRAGASAPRAGAPASRAAEGEPRGRGAVLVSFVLLVVLGVALFGVALVIHPRDRSERVVATPRPEPRAESRPVRPPEPPIPAPAAPAPGTSAAARATTPSAPGTAPAPAPVPAPGATPGASAPGAPAGAPPPTAPRPAPATPAPATPAPPTPAPTTPAPGAAAPTVAVATPPAAPSLDAVVGSVVSPYRLVARTNEATWIRVRTEDGRSSEETVPAGEVREWISNRPFTLTIGNAGGVSFELNGRALPPLGPKGAVIQRIVLPPEAR